MSYREIERTKEFDIKLIKSQLSSQYGATYEVYLSDFKEYYDKAGVIYEYGLIKDLEDEYKDNPKFQAWKQALIDVMAWYGGRVEI
jgi:hypothetical protein